MRLIVRTALVVASLVAFVGAQEPPASSTEAAPLSSRPPELDESGGGRGVLPEAVREVRDQDDRSTGCEAVKTGNIYILFTKVNTPPTNELTGPQTSVWHFGWNTPDSRKYNEMFRAMGLEIAQMWDAADGKLVDMSSDTLPGLPTQEQILELRAKGVQPTRQGGFGYLRGPDGAMIENAQAGRQRALQPRAHVSRASALRDGLVRHPSGRAHAAGPRRSRRGGGADTRAGGRTAVNQRRLQDDAYAPPTWPSFAKTGFVRDPAGGVNIDDISISIRPWPGGGLVSTRGKLVDHWAVSTSNLDATVARLKREGVKFLEEIHPWGIDARRDDRGTRSDRDRDRRSQITRSYNENALAAVRTMASVSAAIAHSPTIPTTSGRHPWRDSSTTLVRKADAGERQQKRPAGQVRQIGDFARGRTAPAVASPDITRKPSTNFGNLSHRNADLSARSRAP